MPSNHLKPDVITRQLRGREVSNVFYPDRQSLSIQFSDGATLLIKPGDQGLIATVSFANKSSGHPDAKHQPTQRQLEYLIFITEYIRRFGRAPAESDIQRRFLVSAPTVNQMMKTLERRGFITRQPGVPRSIRVCEPL